MKNVFKNILLVVFVVGIVNSGWALWGETNAEGTVKNIGTNEITVSVSKGQDMRVQIDDRTKLGGPLGSLNELKQGDRVKVSYKKSGNEYFATLVLKEASSINHNINYNNSNAS